MAIVIAIVTHHRHHRRHCGCISLLPPLCSVIYDCHVLLYVTTIAIACCYIWPLLSSLFCTSIIAIVIMYCCALLLSLPLLLHYRCFMPLPYIIIFCCDILLHDIIYDHYRQRYVTDVLPLHSTMVAIYCYHYCCAVLCFFYILPFAIAYRHVLLHVAMQHC